MKKIITYTMNPALDVHSHAEKIKPSIKIRCEKPGREPGGGGVNVSRALKRAFGNKLHCCVHEGWNHR